MSARTKDFTAKARGIVGIDKPRSLDDFLEDNPQTANTENRSVVRKAGYTESSTEISAQKSGNLDDAVSGKTAREEFRFDADLAERLRRCAFETRCKKTTIVRDALDRYLKDQGF